MPEWRIHRDGCRPDRQGAIPRWAVRRASGVFGSWALGFALAGDWRDSGVCLDAAVDIVLIGMVTQYAITTVDRWKRWAILRIIAGGRPTPSEGEGG